MSGRGILNVQILFVMDGIRSSGENSLLLSMNLEDSLLDSLLRRPNELFDILSSFFELSQNVL